MREPGELSFGRLCPLALVTQPSRFPLFPASTGVPHLLGSPPGWFWLLVRSTLFAPGFLEGGVGDPVPCPSRGSRMAVHGVGVLGRTLGYGSQEPDSSELK